MSLTAILNTAAVHAPLPIWLVEALRHEGQHEIPGVKNNPDIMSVLDEADGAKDGKTVGAFNDDEAYCAKGVSGILELVGIRSARSAWARSYLPWGQSLSGPAVGAVVVFERGPQFGHVSFVVGRDSAGHLICFGFNQSDAVKASPFDMQRVLGFRWPNGYALPPSQKFLDLPLLTIANGVVSRNEA